MTRKEPAYTNGVISAPAKSKPRRRRLALSLLTVIVVIAYVWLFGFQTFMAICVRWEMRKIPIADMRPSALPSVEPSQAAGTRLEYFGYRFEVPWDDFDPGAVKANKTKALIPFRSGVVVSFLTASNHELIDELTTQFHVKTEQLTALRKTETFRSDYEFYSVMLRTTPSAVTPFSSRRFAAAAATLLIIKAIAAPEDSGIFNVNANSFRGFQYGDPTKRPRLIVVHLYSDDRAVEFVFFRKDHQPLDIPQADINRVIQTLSYSSSSSAKS